MSTTDAKSEYADQPLNLAPPYHYGSAVIHDSNSNPRRRSPVRRFLRVLLTIFLALFILNTFTRFLAYPKHLWNQMFSHANIEHGWPEPRDGQVQACIGGNDWSPSSSFSTNDALFPYTEQTSFDLDVSSNLLFLLSRGSYTQGSVEITDGPSNDEGSVNVLVKVSYYDRNALDRARVCLLKRDGDQNGVGIFTPTYWRHRTREDQLHFEVTVSLPVSNGLSSASPLQINAFATNLHNFVQKVGDLTGKVAFETFTLQSSNGPIEAGSVSATRASIQTTNAGIFGTFNTSSYLELKTSNAPIHAEVGLQPSGNGDPTTLTLKTSNGRVASIIHLLDSSSEIECEDEILPAYLVSAQSSNSPLELTFPTSPYPAHLDVTARTSNSPANVALHAAYEGAFSLASSIFRPTLERHDVEDPVGQNRQRNVVQRVIGRGNLQGEVWWGEKGDKKVDGWVDVRTSNSPVTLKL